MGSDGPAETSIDRLLDGRLSIHQPTTGHRAGSDAVLLAAAANPRSGDVVIDVGSGVGTVGLLLAIRQPDASVALVEREPSLAALARNNISRNGLEARVRVEERDIFAPTIPHPRRATLVVSNPPFYTAGTIRRSPDQLRDRAHTIEVNGHRDWLEAMLRVLSPKGRLVVIHRPEALPMLLDACNGRLGGLRIRPIFARYGRPAIRILFGGTLGGRAALVIAEPLILHDVRGAFTSESAAIHRGHKTIPLLD